MIALIVAGAAIGATQLIGGGSADPTSDSSTAPTAQPSGDTTTGATTDATPSPNPSPSESLGLGKTPPPPSACTPAEATLAVTAPATVVAGTAVSATVDVTTAPGATCLMDLGATHVLVQVYSGDDLVWTSAHCAFEPKDRALLLGPEATDSLSVTWPGVRSVEGCAADQPVALPGTYRIVATHDLNGQVTSAEAVVILT